MSTNLRIYLLGAFKVFREGQPLTNQDWRSQQTRQIAKILLARYGQVVPSDQIIDIVWPNDTPAAARRRLHVRISQLRSALGGGKTRLQTVDGGYLFSLDDGCWLDVTAFQTAIEAGLGFQEGGQQLEAIQAYETARELYRGDFLAEDRYLDWTFLPREFFRERYLTLLTELAEVYAQQGRYRLALARCQDALGRDPLRETLYVRLMLYHYYAGERPQALRIYERCCQVLTNELAVEPLESTVKLAEQIQAGSLWMNAEIPRYPPPIYAGRLFAVPYALSETPLVGRDREYAWLIEQWRQSENQVILLQGEAGIGKSRLMAAFAGFVDAAGGTVLQARVSTGERAPFELIRELLQPLIRPELQKELSAPTRAALAPVFSELAEWDERLPALPDLSPEGARNRLYAAIEALLQISTPQSALLLVDDAQRLGQTACEFLARISEKYKVLLSFRSEETPPNHPIYNVFATTSATLQLQPLQRIDVHALIQALAHNEFPDLATDIADQTEGNPLFIITLLQHMFDEGQLYVNEGGSWCVTRYAAATLPATIRATIETRLQRLPRFQRQIFDLAAVLGGKFDFGLLQEAVQKPEEVLLTGLDELINAALLVEPRSFGQPEFSIVHDRYTEVAYATLPEVRKKQLHKQVANAIEKNCAPALAPHYPALANHYGKAEMPEQEYHYASLAGEQAAAQFDHIAALHFLSRALELAPANKIALRARLLFAREKVNDLLGDRQAQKVDLDELVALVDKLEPCQQAEIQLRIAAYEWILGNDNAAKNHLDQSISLAQSCGAAEIEAASFLLRGRGELDQAKARHYLEKARTLAQQAALRPLEGDIVRALGNACFWQNDYKESKNYFNEALVIHKEVGDLRGELSACNNLGLLYQHLGQPDQAIRMYEQGLEICSQIGDRLAEGVLLSNLGGLLAELGKYDVAENRLRQACEIREEVKNDEGVGSILPLLGDLLRRQGKYSEAQKQLKRALEINQRIEHPLQQCLSFDGLSQLYCELGDYATALDYLEKALASVDDEQSPNRVRAIANGCLLHHLGGDNAAALQSGERAFALSQELPQIRAASLTNLGHVLAGSGENDQAQEKYQQALDLRDDLLQPHLGIEPQAGLARLALERGADQEAFTHVESILPHLESGPLTGPDQPSWVYLTCFQVLIACGDARAEEILEAAHTFIQQRAAAIEDEALRQSYLRNVKSNLEILQLCNKQ